MRNLTTLGLAVLRLLDEKPRHPYEVRQCMREQGIDHLIKVTHGALYHAFDVLAKAEFIEPVETTREGKRPERTVYAITDDGREIAAGRLRELLSTLESEYPTYGAALAFMSLLTTDDAAAQLERRAVLLESELASVTTSSDALLKRGVEAVHIVELRHLQAHLRADLELTRAIVDDIREGRLHWQAGRRAAE
ncbi:Transcriptional regulator PadR-like family protein [Saccharopolyspora antimicrobica]|uniref:PadR family transcriptional regulator n=1 Tax=Saccharopolyspora antimicrobica TaxID=455193 RepID=A0A1I5KY78_9PSEU|nr:PadR family transcriptional regulator [Saccharopolyspora antimicrobica]RKT89084.1 PadR family transcriptional regulator [Saccharopolyspora antimicrobica]SFO90034.1 Transcriptional regulator PadR-like family protein [Saccharopolyspora antimicrobica]